MKLKFLASALISLLISSCASVVPPSGGPVDPVPPQVVSQYPSQNAVNFKGQDIEIEFNEFLAPISDPGSIIISPALTKAPEVTVRKKKIKLHFTETLAPSTTYTINFADNIKDNHEGNPLSNFTIVFSTGSYIDTGTLNGAVVDSRDLSVQKDMTVMLFSNLSDSAPLTLKPSYISKTDLNGLYTFRNIAPGSYKIYALKDKNKNLNPDHAELFAFHSKNVSVKGDSSRVEKLYASPFKKHEEIIVTKVRRENEGTYVFGFNQDITDSSIEVVSALQAGGTSLSQLRILQDTIKYYYIPAVKSDSIILNVTSGTRVLSTHTFEYPKIPQASFYISMNDAPARPMDTLKLYCGHPVKEIKKERIEILSDDSSKALTECLINPSNPFELWILFNKTAGKKYSFTLSDSSLVSFYNTFNRRYKNSITIQEEKRYGSINIDIENKDAKPLIIYLLDKDNRIRRTYFAKTDLKIEESWIEPGDYMLKVILDKNGNNRFDVSDYESHRQTEPVFIYSSRIVIKSNWEVSGLRISPVFEQ